MDEWELEVTLSNATGLKKVSTLEQNPYCSVWYSQGDSQRTPTHKKGGTNPKWNNVVQLPISHNQLENLHGSVTVEILHESRGRDSKIGTATIPLSDMGNGEGTIQMYDVDPVGKVGVMLMGKKKPGALTSSGRGRGTGVGSSDHPSSSSRSGFNIRKRFGEIVQISNGINSLSSAKDNLMNWGTSMQKHEQGYGREYEEDGYNGGGAARCGGYNEE